MQRSIALGDLSPTAKFPRLELSKRRSTYRLRMVVAEDEKTKSDSCEFVIMRSGPVSPCHAAAMMHDDCSFMCLTGVQFDILWATRLYSEITCAAH